MSTTWITADQIYDGKGGELLDAAIAVTDQGTIAAIEPLDGHPDAQKYSGSLCPGFINAHCHLELSHLHAAIPKGLGMTGFLGQINPLIYNTDKQTQLEAAKTQDQAMWEAGIVGCFDISNSAATATVKADSPIQYHTFVEVFGPSAESAAKNLSTGLGVLEEFEGKGLSAGLSPHAPYSTHRSIIQKAFELAGSKLPVSIHMQESPAEIELFEHRSGPFIKFYEGFKGTPEIDFSAGSPLAYVLEGLTHDLKLLLVHNTMTSTEDIFLSAPFGAWWCFCPSANLYIENRLPEFSIWNEHSERVMVGTDSLASNSTLSVLEELICIAEHRKSVDPAVLVQFACWNPASYMSWEDRLGTLEAGRKPGINLISPAADGSPIGVGSKLEKLH